MTGLPGRQMDALKGLTLTLTAAMHAAVRDSVGLDPADDTYPAGWSRDLVDEGVSELLSAELAQRAGKAIVVSRLVQDTVLATTAPTLILRSVIRESGEPLKELSLYSRNASALVAYSVTDSGAMWRYSIGSVESFTDYLAMPYIDTASSNRPAVVVPMSDVRAWDEQSTAASTRPLASVESLPFPSRHQVDAVGNVAILDVQDREAVDARNVAIVRHGSTAWLLEASDEDPKLASLRWVDGHQIKGWIQSALHSVQSR